MFYENRLIYQYFLLVSVAQYYDALKLKKTEFLLPYNFWNIYTVCIKKLSNRKRRSPTFAPGTPQHFFQLCSQVSWDSKVSHKKKYVIFDIVRNFEARYKTEKHTKGEKRIAHFLGHTNRHIHRHTKVNLAMVPTSRFFKLVEQCKQELPASCIIM